MKNSISRMMATPRRVNATDCQNKNLGGTPNVSETWSHQATPKGDVHERGVDVACSAHKVH